MRITGRYENLGNIQYFIPYPLPPQNPPFELTPEMIALYGEVMLELGKLNEMAIRIPNKERFIKACVIKEALLTSAIEGVNTTIIDVFTQPLLETKPDKNTQLVLNYSKALSAALIIIKENNLPISSRVILESHKVLMKTGEGDKSNPGEFRKQFVKVGNLIPPASNYIPKLMSELEQFINNPDTFDQVIKAGLAHVQFETIHPFLDGNGRIGRLLIVLTLIEGKILTEPIIYPSYYIKKHQLEYYRLLDKVRTHGDFESWIKFYLLALKESSVDAYNRAQEIEQLELSLKKIISEDKSLTIKSQESRLNALQILFNYPIISVNKLSQEAQVSYNTASQIISDFIRLNILKQNAEQKRNKLYTFEAYIKILEK